MSNIDDILEEFNTNAGASADAVRTSAESLRMELPIDYASFLGHYNGGEGFIGETYLILWKAEELAEMNAAYQVDEYAPGLLLIGSDGGGEAFAFDTRNLPWVVVQVPFVGMDLRYAKQLGASFEDFLNRLANE